MSKLSTIQMLRGLAALAVAFAHLSASELKLGGSSILGKWTLNGFAGLDLFFVISGFVMVWVTGSRHKSAQGVGEFWLLRLIRIYPLWWLVCGAIFIVWLIKPEWVFQSQIATPNIIKSFLLLPDYSLPLHAVGWTLIHELWFYVVFGLFMFAPRRFLPVLLTIWGSIILVFAIVGFEPVTPWLKLIRHPLSLEFIAGAFVGLFALANILPFPKTLIAVSLVGFALCAVNIGNNGQTFFAGEWQRVIYFAMPSALLLWGLVGLEKKGIAAPKPLVKLGDWSYALYLIHVPVFSAILRLTMPMSQDGIIDNFIYILASIIIAIFAAFILHNFFERPILKIANAAVRRKS